jgi:solute carrier family 25 (mitochondrial phosphate transporter), member 3
MNNDAFEESVGSALLGSSLTGIATAAVRQQRRCWTIFLVISCAFLLIFLTLVSFLLLREHRQASSPSINRSGAKKPNSRTLEYFVLCVIGGILSGIPHVLMTPVDIVKCRLQVGEYRSVQAGLAAMWREAMSCGEVDVGALSTPRRRSPRLVVKKAIAVLGVLYRGWLPTIIGYCLQGALKFGFYEYFKYRFAMMIPFQMLLTYLTWVFVVASACAELIADVALAPWETVKVRMQTQQRGSSRVVASPASPVGVASVSSVKEVMTSIWFFEGGLSAFFRCLVPLWCRQVPYTVVKFTTFEKSVVLIQWLLFPSHSHQGGVVESNGQRLLVALLAGYVAGTLCAVVSQPADVVVSKLTAAQGGEGDGKRQGKKLNWLAVIKEIGFRGMWKGLSARVLLVGTLSGAQWAIYDSFKVLSGAV